MIKTILIAAFFASSAQQASASAMSEELSKCLALRELAEKHEAWKADFHRFQQDSTLTAKQRLDVSRMTMAKVSDRLMKVQRLGRFEGQNRALISDSSRFLKDLDEGLVTKTTAQKIMNSALPKFELALDTSLEKANSNLECDLVQGPASAPATNNGKAALR